MKDKKNEEMLSYVEKLKDKYTDREIKIFLHGYIFAKALEAKEYDEEYQDFNIEEIMEIIFDLLMKALDKEKEEKNSLEQRTLFIDTEGKNETCVVCGSNVFIKIKLHCHCNSCQAKYEIERKK